MCGLIYGFKFPVLAGAAQKVIVYAAPELKKIAREIYSQPR